MWTLIASTRDQAEIWFGRNPAVGEIGSGMLGREEWIVRVAGL